MNMSKSEQRTAAAWFKDAGSRPDDWESVPRPKDPPRPGRKLGAQITIRLEPEVAERLREMADERGVGYTSLARELLEDAVVSAAPAEILVGSTLHVMARGGVWALVREGERSVVFANSDRDVVVQWARDIAAAERGAVKVHEPS
jgi:hypothetical protein